MVTIPNILDSITPCNHQSTKVLNIFIWDTVNNKDNQVRPQFGIEWVQKQFCFILWMAIIHTAQFGLEPWPHQSPKPIFPACDCHQAGKYPATVAAPRGAEVWGGVETVREMPELSYGELGTQKFPNIWLIIPTLDMYSDSKVRCVAGKASSWDTLFWPRGVSSTSTSNFDPYSIYQLH